MVQFTHIQTHTGGLAGFVDGISDLDIVTIGGVTHLVSVSGQSGGISSYQVDTDAPVAASLKDQQAHGPGETFGTAPLQIEVIDPDGSPSFVAFGGPDEGMLGYDFAPVNGELSAAQGISVGDFNDGSVTGFQSITSGGQTFLYASHYLTGGLTTYEVQNGTPVEVDQDGVGSSYQGVDITGMARATMDGVDYLFTASTVQNAVSAYRILNDGTPEVTGTTGAANGLGLAAPTALVTAEVAGTTFVVVAGAGSGSLSVLKLTSGGSLFPTDHVLDGLGTRFQGVTALTSVEFSGQTFILAGGADDGISLLSLLPDGRLLQRGTIADTDATTLNNITDIAATVSGGDLAVFVASQNEVGITEFRIDIGALGGVQLASSSGENLNGSSQNDMLAGQGGDDTLDGGAGDDIIVDGAGSDVMIGGLGADIFVLTDDGMPDAISDYNPAVDALDLSALGLLYSVSQLTIQSTGSGATITFFGEVLNITSHDFTPLSAADFTDATIVNIQRMPMWGVVVDQVLMGTSGADELVGDTGDDTLNGGAGPDVLTGGAGRDTVTYMDATAGVWVDLQNPNFMKGDALGDLISDVEVVYGTVFADQLRGDSGVNEFYGGAYSDRLYGRAGDDLLFGEGGADALYGNTGADTMTGGEGWIRDRFIYFSTADSLPGAGLRDIITDFQTGKDRIEISRFDADPITPGNQVFSFIGDAAFSGVGQVRFEQNIAAGHTLAQADIDGDGAADFEVELSGVIDLISTDFLL